MKMIFPSDATRKGAKYGNRRVRVGEYEFDSAKEARRFSELLALLRAGKISDLVLQPEYVIARSVKDPATGRRLPERKYIADFRYVDENGKTVVEDVKSEATRKDKTYRLKRQIFLSLYGEKVNFREV